MPADPAPVTHLRCVLIPRFNMLSLTCMIEAARIANYLSPAPLYTHSFHSFDGTPIGSSNGIDLPATPPPARLTRNDTVLLFGSWGAEHYRGAPLMSWLRLQPRLGVTLCGVEMAPYILARAGLLAGRAATVQWSYLPGFQEAFPDLHTTEQLHTKDGPIMTCAGGTGALDLMLCMIAEAHGAALAGEVAAQMMHHPQRAGTTPQRPALGRGATALPGPVQTAIALIEAHMAEPLSIPEIAAQTGLSQRQLVRQFGEVMGCSVVQFARLMRLQHARVLLITTDLGVREVATASGFNSLSHFAYAFKSCFGKRPSDYRQAWPEGEAAPQWPGTLARFLDEAPARRRAARHAPAGSGGIA